MAGSRGRRHGWLALAPYSQACRLAIADRGNVLGGVGEAVTRHVGIETFKLTGLYDEGLVPDSDTAVGADALVEVLPHLQVWIGGIAGELLQIFEATPI